MNDVPSTRAEAIALMNRKRYVLPPVSLAAFVFHSEQTKLSQRKRLVLQLRITIACPIATE
jgi:hypothetical protein